MIEAILALSEGRVRTDEPSSGAPYWTFCRDPQQVQFRSDDE